MQGEDTTSEPLTTVAGHKGDLNWADLHAAWTPHQRRFEAKTQSQRRREAENSCARGPAPLAGESAKEVTPQVCSWRCGVLSWGRNTTELSRVIIREIHSLSEFTPLPCTPAFVLGLSMWGQIFPYQHQETV